ncbi:MAG: acylphosphatase [Sphingobium sp.]|nr:acylphosphatase [Sphingobium sp.]
MDIVAKHLIIKGRVQRVWFRGWIVQSAQALGLVGWVRNRANGDVEALVQGPRADVERLIDFAWQGPSAARVDTIEVSEAECTALTSFDQRETL